jgi:hypothetical protein
MSPVPPITTIFMILSLHSDDGISQPSVSTRYGKTEWQVMTACLAE